MATHRTTEAQRLTVWREDGGERRPADRGGLDAGPFYSILGPTDGPIRRGDCPALLDVVGAPGPARPDLGEAEFVAHHPDPDGSVALFHLRVGGERLGDLWECRGRRFVRWGVPPAGAGA